MKSEPAIEKFIDILFSGRSRSEKKRALLAIARYGTPDEPGLIDVLRTFVVEEEDPVLRYYAVRALEQLNFRDDFVSDGIELREKLSALCRFEEDEELNRQMVRHPRTFSGRREFAENPPGFMEESEHEGMLYQLEKMLDKEKNPLIISKLVRILARYSDPKTVERLKNYLSHEDDRVRANFVEGLAFSEQGDYDTILRAVLNDTSPRVRAAAVLGLVKSDHLTALSVIRKMLLEPSSEAREAAAYAARKTGLDITQLLVELLLMPDCPLETRLKTIELMGECADPSTVDFLRIYLEEAGQEEKAVILEAMDALLSRRGRASQETKFSRKLAGHSRRKAGHGWKERPDDNNDKSNSLLRKFSNRKITPQFDTGLETGTEEQSAAPSGDRPEKKDFFSEKLSQFSEPAGALSQVDGLEREFEKAPEKFEDFALLAKQLSKSGRLESSIEKYRLARDRDDKSAFYRLKLLGFLYMEAGRFSDAEICFSRAREKKNDDLETGLALAEIYRLEHKFNQAIFLLTELKSLADIPSIHFLMAKVLLECGQTGEFIKSIDVALKNSRISREEATVILDYLVDLLQKEDFSLATNSQFKSLVALAYFKSNLAEKAEELFLELLRGDVKPAETLGYLWTLYSSREDYEKAETIFRALHDNSPDNILIFEYYIKAMIARGKENEALRLLVNFAMRKLDNFSRFQIANLIYDSILSIQLSSNFLFAREAAEFLVLSYPDNIRYRMCRAGLLARIGAFDDAKRALEEIIALSSESRKFMDDIMLELKRVQALIAEREKIVAGLGKRQDIRYIRMNVDGVEYSVPVRYESVREHLRNRETIELEYRIYEFLTGEAPTKELVKAIRRFVEIAPCEYKVVATILLARALIATGSRKEALELLDGIAATLPGGTGASTIFSLGEAFYSLGEWQQALVYFGQTKKLDENFPGLEEKIKLCQEKIDGGVSDGATVMNRGPLDGDSRYRILNEIGRGGMSTVYLALDLENKREVAIKVPSETLASNEEYLKRFRQEALVLLQLSHPGIIEVYEIKDATVPCIVMELIKGRCLRAVLNDGEWKDLPRMISYARQIAGAISYAHEKGVIHRDIKPENVFVLEGGEKIKIMDFGIAKVLDSIVATRAGEVMGTVAYMSPEQRAGRKVDERSDIYSMGIMFYEMFTGTKPFTEGDLTYQHLYVVPKGIRSHVPSLPVELEQLVAKCLEKSPDARYQKVSEILQDIDKISLLLSQ